MLACLSLPPLALSGFNDWQGFELFALAGVRRALARQRIDNLIFEFGGVNRWIRNCQTAADGAKVLQDLANAGYELRFLHTHFVANVLARQTRRWPQVSGQGVNGDTFTYSIVPYDDL